MKRICICIEVSAIIGQPKSTCDTLCQDRLINASSKRRSAVMILLSHKQTALRITWQDLWLTLGVLLNIKHIFVTLASSACLSEEAQICFEMERERDVSSGGGCGERWMWMGKRVCVAPSPCLTRRAIMITHGVTVSEKPRPLVSACFKNTLHYLQPLSVLIAGMLLQTIFLSMGSAVIISVRLRRVKPVTCF